MDLLSKRLLGAMQIGFRLEAEHGRIYIIVDPEADYVPQDLREFSKKTYGTIEDALDLIDEQLTIVGYNTTLQQIAEDTLLRVNDRFNKTFPDY
jgi:hypothetical protein